MADYEHLPYCSDCGEARIPHALAKIDDAVTLIFNIINMPTGAARRALARLVSRIPYDEPFARALEWLAAHGIGEIARAPDARDSIRTKALWESARTLGIDLFQYRIRKNHPYGIMVARGGGETLVYEIVPRPKRWVSPSLDWMDDKGILKRKLRRANLPTAGGAAHTTLRGALSTFRRVVPPVIVKPHFGSRGRHTTLAIETEEDLRRAFAIGKQIAFDLVVEEEFRGKLYRVTLIGGTPRAVARRDHPHVIGDGISTIRELIAKANEDPRRDGFSFYPLQENERMDRELARQKLTKESVPEKDRFVILNDKVSRLHGTTTVDVTDEVHPEMLSLFADIGAYLGDAIVGVDFIVEDIGRSPQGQTRFGVVECNAMPYVDLHHYPFEGKPRPVAEDLWKLCFPSLK